MFPALLITVAVFAVLALARIGGARRAALIQRWPAVLLAIAAIIALARAQVWFGIGLAGAAVIAWVFTTSPPRRSAAAPDPADTEARAVLGVGANATIAEIRAAYRTKMARAHPDRGGSHAAAARLTAARDKLLRK